MKFHVSINLTTISGYNLPVREHGKANSAVGVSIPISNGLKEVSPPLDVSADRIEGKNKRPLDGPRNQNKR